MNVSMPIAAVLLDLGFPASAVKAVPILARTAGLLAHLAEEQEQPARLRAGARRRGGGRVRALSSRRCPGRSSSRSTTRATAPSSPTCSSARPSTARSSTAFTRRPRGHRAAAADREGRAPRDAHARQPVRRAPLRRAVRDRPDLLDERHHRRAELHPADGGRPRQLGDRLRAQLRGLGHRAPASASSRPTTPGRSWPARRSPPSTASASRTSRSAPGTPSA